MADTPERSPMKTTIRYAHKISQYGRIASFVCIDFEICSRGPHATYLSLSGVSVEPESCVKLEVSERVLDS
jgi:hypothetical protein